MANNRYTKSSLMTGERIIYSAKMHFFCYFNSVLFIILGMFMCNLISFPSVSEHLDTKSQNQLNRQIHNAKQSIGKVSDSVKEEASSILESLPDEFQSIIQFFSKVRLIYFGLIFMFIGFVNILRIYLNKISSEFVITNKRVVYKFGFVSVDSIEINLDRVEGVKINQTVTDRIVGRGNVLINSIGFEQIEIKKISRPDKFRNKILETMEKYVDRRST